MRYRSGQSDVDCTIEEGDSDRLTLAGTEEPNRQADKHVTIVTDLLCTVGTGVTDTRSGATTFTRTSGVTFIGKRGKSRRLRGIRRQHLDGLVKGGRGDTIALVKGANLADASGNGRGTEHQESNIGSGDTGLASGGIVLRHVRTS
jgi:hypothetical protein